MSTYVVSDLHGNYTVFERGLETIGFSSSDTLICLGDCIDRGNDGIRILQEIKMAPNMDTLLGNHEFMMLNSIDINGGTDCIGTDSLLWLFSNGGNITYLKYAYLPEEERKKLLFWLIRRKIITEMDIKDKKYILTHSCYVPTDIKTGKSTLDKPYNELSHETSMQALWFSPYRKDTYCDPEEIYGKYPAYTFITGHVPIQSIKILAGKKDYTELPEPYTNEKASNMIDIDGGLSYNGKFGIKGAAIFLRLDDMEHFVIQ